jgi:hypothetical protein
VLSLNYKAHASFFHVHKSVANYRWPMSSSVEFLCVITKLQSVCISFFHVHKSVVNYRWPMSHESSLTELLHDSRGKK